MPCAQTVTETLDSLFVPGDSWLHRLDPRVKLAFALMATAALLSVERGAVVLGCLVLCHGMLLTARLPLGRLLGAWRRMLPVTLMILLLWPLFTPAVGAPAWSFGPLTLAWGSVVDGVVAAVRLNALAFAWLVWLFTTDQPAMVAGFRQLGLPYTWGVTLAITLRYIPSLYATWERVLEAQRARGLVTAHPNPLRAARAHLPALVAVLILALRDAETLSRALEARAFGAPGCTPTLRRSLHLRVGDALALALSTLGFGGLLVAGIAGWV
ncbi:MAG: energy-coupling factor transporter transmembrane component T [Anaerolineae bacterium]|nr:energy-coupling factor transporter transmembrane component T [Anaerolineae bacterium]